MTTSDQKAVEENFPHVVKHNVPYGYSEWAAMWDWLTVQVGDQNHTWTWLVINEIRFVHKSDAALFSVTWS